MNEVKGYIICESPSFFNQPEIIKDIKPDSKNNGVNRVRIKTILQDADNLNRNKRIYPKSVLVNGLNSEYVKERLATKTWFGECGHPLKPDLQRQVYLDQTNISHIVTEVWWEGNILKGIVEAANTARGKDFDGLVRQGSKVAFSLRAIGPITEKKGDAVIVKDPLTMLYYDWVVHPSHASAYMESIISESVNLGGYRNSTNINESVFTPFYEEVDYVKMASKNFKVIKESLELESEDITLSKDNKKVIIQEGSDKIVVKLEDYITRELNSYMKNL